MCIRDRGNRSNMVLQAAFFKLANVIPVEDAVAHICLLYTARCV